jgi:hypothetical protein
MTTPSLLPFSPDSALHGAEVTIAVQTIAGAYVTIGELYGFDWTEDQNMVKVPAFGSRLDGMRRGRFSVTGTATGYYINGALRDLVQGYTTINDATGVSSAIYHSQAPFNRYRLRLTTTNASITGPTDFVNVTFGKDVMKLASDKIVDETLDWSAEDVLGQ